MECNVEQFLSDNHQLPIARMRRPGMVVGHVDSSPSGLSNAGVGWRFGSSLCLQALGTVPSEARRIRESGAALQSASPVAVTISTCLARLELSGEGGMRCGLWSLEVSVC